MRPLARTLVMGLTLLAVFAAGCWQSQEPQAPSGTGAGKTGAGSAQIKAAGLSGSRLAAFLSSHQKGLGHMERYEYSDAVGAFREALRLAPGDNATKINLAIALLNDTGKKAEDAKKAGAVASTTANFDESMQLLDEVIRSEPENLHAHYCRGLILEYIGEIGRAHREYQFVVDRDPKDASAWLKVGMTLPNPKDPDSPSSLAGPEQADRLVEIYTKALELNPYQVTAMYRLQQAYTWAAVFGARHYEAKKKALEAKREEITALWLRLDRYKNPAGTGEPIDLAYGEAGRYATVIDPIGVRREDRARELRMPRFETPERLRVGLPEGHRWVKGSEFDGPLAVAGRIRARFGAAVAHLDIDNDGKLDLYLCTAVKTPSGIRDALLKNRGDGQFEDVSAAWGLPAERASIGVAAGDFDADGRLDLFLTGAGENRLLRNLDGKSFEDVTNSLPAMDVSALCLGARWLDIDQDGDLDLYVIRYCAMEHAEQAFTREAPPAGLTNLAFRNDGRPSPLGGPAEADAPRATDFYEKATQGLSIAWTLWDAPESKALLGGANRHTGLAALDLDLDRDLDFVLAADGGPPVAVLNDRLGRFRAVELTDLDPKGPLNGAAVLDADKDGRPDLVLVTPEGRLSAWRNEPAQTETNPQGFALRFWPIDVRQWRAAQALDLDLDSWTDLLGLPAPQQGDAPAPAWARNEGSRLAPVPLALGPDTTARLVGLEAADVVGDSLPDLVLVRDGEGPYLAVNQGNGNRWLALSLGGRWKFGKGPDGGPARSNPQGLGTRVLLQGPELTVSYDYVPISSGLGQSAGGVVLGMGPAQEALLVRLTWPDGVMQSELNAQAGQPLAVRELNRKTGSCPVLFTFDGTRFACIGDFLGGGGLGYLVAPGVYSVPDRDEAVAIRGDQLRAVEGAYLLSIVEPMDELAYLDHFMLEVVDRPPGVETAPDERFAPGGNRPTGRLLAWREKIEPVKATDLKGNDATDRLRALDNRTVDTFRKLSHWIGYAEEHGIVLDFGDRLSGFGPADRLALCLAGWVEYPYSQTNYAAATAGVALKPPVLERQRDDGTWELIEWDPGYPAGLPRLTTLELTGKLVGPRCVLRLRTNMECYYDQAFVAVIDSEARPRVTAMPVREATLVYRGYLREVSADGRPPLWYDFDAIDPAPLARLEGRLTRFGDVTPLLRADDDQLCIVGPGDVVRLSFDAASVPVLPDGWTRSYVLRAIGYCKDADPFTAGSDTVEPLPWKGMPDFYPFGPENERPRGAEYEAYLRLYQTRRVAMWPSPR